MLANYDNEAFRGIPYQEGDQDKVRVRIYNNSGGDLTNGAVKLLSTMVDITDSDNPILRGIPIAPATNAAVKNQVIVIDDPSGGIVDGEWGYATLRGMVQALCYGDTDIVKGDQLEILNAGTAFTMLTSATVTSATVGTNGIVTGNGCAIAMESYATATNALKWVYLLGLQTAIT
jgi:hypothetical protein